MPPKRSNLSRNTRNAARVVATRRNESDGQHNQRCQSTQERNSRSRSAYSSEERESHNTNDRLRMRGNRDNCDRSDELLRMRMDRQTRATVNLHRAAFDYNNTIDYSSHGSVIIGTMSHVCQHCKAFKFKSETPGLCCANGKVKLPALNCPPEPLRSLVSGSSPQSKHFLTNIQKYNSCFQMTSFGATNIIRDNFMPTFKVISSQDLMNIKFDSSDIHTNSDPSLKYLMNTIQIQGQIYHKVGSLLPYPDTNYQFLQIYFIGNTNNEVDQRCAIIGSSIRREIVVQLQDLFHDENELVRLFQTALDRMPSDAGEHARRFNAPTIDDVAIVIVGEEFKSRDIVLHRRNQQLQRVSETHRCYDALQYPILLWQGEDGY